MFKKEKKIMECKLRIEYLENLICHGKHTYIKCDEELVGGTGHGDEYCMCTYICTKCGKKFKETP